MWASTETSFCNFFLNTSFLLLIKASQTVARYMGCIFYGYFFTYERSTYLSAALAAVTFLEIVAGYFRIYFFLL